MASTTFHLDEKLGHDQREAIRDDILGRDGIIAAASQEKTPHLMIVEYDPDKQDPVSILEMIKTHGVHAERLG